MAPNRDPASGATLVDALDRELQIQYFADVYPVQVEAVGYRSLYDPENVKPRS